MASLSILIPTGAAEASWLGRPFVKILDEATIVPGETHAFASFAAPLEPRFTLRNQIVHIVAPAATVNFAPSRALLRYEAGVLSTLVFTNTVAPDGAKFTDTFYPTDLEDGAINFTGYTPNGPGLFELRNGVIKTAISTTDPLPNTAGNLIGFGGNTRRGSRVVGGGTITGGHVGAFLLDGTTLSKIADDNNTDLPGVVGGFAGILGQGIFGFDGNKVVFGTTTPTFTASGVFSYAVGGGFEKIADTTDFMPGDAGRFNGFGEADIEGGTIFFVGLTSANQRRLFARGTDGALTPIAPLSGLISAAGPKSVYYANSRNVTRWTDGFVETVLRAGDTLGGKSIQTVFDLSGQGDDLAIGVRFTDRTAAIYLVAGSTPVSQPQITQDLPADLTVQQGGSIRLIVAATGGSLAYQWFKGPAAIQNATNSSLAFASATLADAATYKVVVSNAAGNANSSSLALSVEPAVAPNIVAQPEDTRVALGGTVTFSVTSEGSPLFYQWLFKGQPLPNATFPSLRLNGVKESELGAYSVVIANPAGTRTSNPAILSLALPPTIVSPPVGGLVAPGDSFTFNVAATGDAPFTYRWTKNNATIPDATNASYTISAASAADAGTYAVSIVNPYGTAFSVSALLAIDSIGAKVPIATIRSAEPALDGGRIVVPRDNSNSYGQLDLYENGAFRTIVNTSMTATGATFPFKNIATAEVDGADIAFTATLSDDSSGLFLQNGAETKRIVDATVTLPSTALKFGALSSFSLAGGKVAFQATAVGNDGGVFLYDGAALQKIAFKGDAAPGGRTFLNFGGLHMAGNAIVFWASLDTGGGGLFAWKNNALSKIIDYQSAALPGLNPGFFAVPNQTPATDGTSATFTTSSGNNVLSLWSIKLDGTSPVKLLQSGQSAPGGGQYASFNTLIMDNGGLVIGARNQAFQQVIYYLTNGVATRIFGDNDAFNNFTGTLKISRDGYSQGRLAIGRTQFEFAHDILVINIAAAPVRASAPQVARDPENLALDPGATAQFTVQANAAGLAYQWTKGGNPILNANAPTFTIPAVVALDAGDYACILTNGAGSVTSKVARLTINAQTLPIVLKAGAGLRGARFIEFDSTAGATYQIQYSPSPLGPWSTAPTPVPGTGARIQWFDIGPPETPALPTSTPVRLFRVVKP